MLAEKQKTGSERKERQLAVIGMRFSPHYMHMTYTGNSPNPLENMLTPSTPPSAALTETWDWCFNEK